MSYAKLSVMPETKKLVEQCKKELLRVKPELEGVFITENKVVYEIAKYYMEH